MALTLYHRTADDAAITILADGFKDGTGTYLTDRKFTGVWVSDRPLDGNEGAEGNTLLALDFDGDLKELQDYEWLESIKSYREWLVPAVFLNARCRVRVVEIDPDLSPSGVRSRSRE